ncbi:MAG: tRNA glutamyl-Q(34) synthetase GluQRS [Pseudomonadota bacterium]
MRTERFAPSPTGPLHLGHAFSALTAWDRTQAASGRFLLRFEDIDRSRARPEWETAILDDLRWLGLDWPTPVLRQSTRLPAYRAALETLRDRGLLFACTCTRRDIAQAATAPQEGDPPVGPDGVIYPGTCRANRLCPGAPLPANAALRLDMRAATRSCGALAFAETGPATAMDRVHVAADTLINGVGDVVLARRDLGTSYHLSVVVDDAHQGVTHVTRGADLFAATQIHVLLQHLLSVPTPSYHHHRLIRDADGRRLAKRDDARALAKYRAEGTTTAALRRLLGLGAARPSRT